MVKAVFLDRDGTINRSVVRDGQPYPPENLAAFQLLPGVEEACALFRAAGFALVVATNQPDVGRGTATKESVEQIHDWLMLNLPLDRIEVCYDSGAEPSPCRKPNPGMLLRAAHEMAIDLTASWMVGDRWRDVDCGRAAGCRTVFIDNGYAEQLRAQPDFRVASLLEAAGIVCSHS